MAATMILVPSVPLAYGNVMALPKAALLNSMASRVFRKLKLGLIDDNVPSTFIPSTTPVRFVSHTSLSTGKDFAFRSVQCECQCHSQESSAVQKVER